MAHTQPGLDERHRDKDGEISKKHGNTFIYQNATPDPSRGFCPREPDYARDKNVRDLR
jgi:hypothetical protein